MFAAQKDSASDIDGDELSFMSALSARCNVGMAAMTTSNENKAFSVIDKVNDNEVAALPIYNGNGKNPNVGRANN